MPDASPSTARSTRPSTPASADARRATSYVRLTEVVAGEQEQLAERDGERVAEAVTGMGCRGLAGPPFGTQAMVRYCNNGFSFHAPVPPAYPPRQSTGPFPERSQDGGPKPSLTPEGVPDRVMGRLRQRASAGV